MISLQVVRQVIAWIVLSAVMLTIIVFFSIARGGAISQEVAFPAANKLLNIYGPILAILTGFYFSNSKTTMAKKTASKESFFLALFFVGILVFTPPIIIGASETIESAMRVVDFFSGICTSISSACLMFFFSKSVKEG